MLISLEAQNMYRNIKNFIDKLLEKNSNSEVVRLPPHADFIRGIFYTPVFLSEDAESRFLVRCEAVLCPKRLSNVRFQMLVLFKGSQ